MAGGPLFPVSAVAVTADRIFSYVYVSGGANWKHEECYAFQASLGADSTWRFCFHMPPTTLPTGTCKIRVLARANAATGVAKWHASCADVAVTADPAAATLTSTGTQTSTWAASGNDKYNETKVSCPVTPTAGNVLIMDFVGETTSWTLAQIMAFQVSIIWE